MTLRWLRRQFLIGLDVLRGRAARRECVDCGKRHLNGRRLFLPVCWSCWRNNVYPTLGEAKLQEYDYTVRVKATDEAADKFMREALAGYGNATYGHRTATGRLLTDADCEKLADEAERGYDLTPMTDQELRRRGL